MMEIEKQIAKQDVPQIVRDAALKALEGTNLKIAEIDRYGDDIRVDLVDDGDLTLTRSWTGMPSESGLGWDLYIQLAEDGEASFDGEYILIHETHPVAVQAQQIFAQQVD